jgi:hypothetical protein
MAKSRKLQPIDWDRVKKGLIPWTSDGYMDVIEFRQKLERTPKDDWDLAPHYFSIKFTEGKVQTFRLNELMPDNQIGLFVKKQYARQGITVVAAHLTRYYEMNWFLRTHRKRFERENFIRKTDESGRIDVNDCLFQALAQAPFPRSRGRGKHKFPTFDLDSIVQRTRELVAEEEEQGPP